MGPDAAPAAAAGAGAVDRVADGAAACARSMPYDVIARAVAARLSSAAILRYPSLRSLHQESYLVTGRFHATPFA